MSLKRFIVMFHDGEITNAALAPSNKPIGGFSILQVETAEQAFFWAEKIAKACRCSQEVREMI
jgi:hypothetical protein